MKLIINLFVVALFVISIPAFSQMNEAVETNWQGVKATLITCQQDNDRLYLKVMLENSTDSDVKSGKAVSFKDVYVLDTENDRKLFVLKVLPGFLWKGRWKGY